MRTALPVISLLLAACNAQSSEATANSGRSALPEETRTAPASQPVSPAKAFNAEEETSLYSFSFGWSAEAAAVPQLVERFTSDMEKTKAELIKAAKDDREERTKAGFDYHPHASQTSYETAGSTDRLLSLESSMYGFTGGAHGSSGSGSLVWDRKLNREVSMQDLLQPGMNWTGAIRRPFCILLDREREKRRGEPVKADDLFGNCPELRELTILLKDNDKNRRLDHVVVIADQYVAGPYAEGPYEISLPITAAMMERLKPEYRGSFEARPPIR